MAVARCADEALAFAQEHTTLSAALEAKLAEWESAAADAEALG